MVRDVIPRDLKQGANDGASIDWNRFRGCGRANLRTNEEFGSESHTKVAVMREFKNTRENSLGIPLPKGRVRFYRTDGTNLEFTGENQIDHTPADELVKIYTGEAFDLVGERKRTNFRVDSANRWANESFEISLRNRKKVPVTIRVVEHLFRWSNWEITKKDLGQDFQRNFAPIFCGWKSRLLQGGARVSPRLSASTGR